jgi:hypothetical protein
VSSASTAALGRRRCHVALLSYQAAARAAALRRSWPSAEVGRNARGHRCAGLTWFFVLPPTSPVTVSNVDHAWVGPAGIFERFDIRKPLRLSPAAAGQSRATRRRRPAMRVLDDGPTYGTRPHRPKPRRAPNNLADLAQADDGPWTSPYARSRGSYPGWWVTPTAARLAARGFPEPLRHPGLHYALKRATVIKRRSSPSLSID